MPFINSEMQLLLETLSFKNLNLEKKLEKIALSGFCFKAGCYLLKELTSLRLNVPFNPITDPIGYECWVNDLNTCDYCVNCHMEQAFLFIYMIFKNWKKEQSVNKLVAIFSSSEIGVNIRFHVSRDCGEWISNDLEDFIQPIMKIDSNEIFFIDSLLNSSFLNVEEIKSKFN